MKVLDTGLLLNTNVLDYLHIRKVILFYKAYTIESFLEEEMRDMIV